MHHEVTPVFNPKATNIDSADGRSGPAFVELQLKPVSFTLCFGGCVSPDSVQELIASGEVGLRWSRDGG